MSPNFNYKPQNSKLFSSRQRKHNRVYYRSRPIDRNRLNDEKRRSRSAPQPAGSVACGLRAFLFFLHAAPCVSVYDSCVTGSDSTVTGAAPRSIPTHTGSARGAGTSYRATAGSIDLTSRAAPRAILMHPCTMLFNRAR